MSDSKTKFEEMNSNDNRAQLNKAITEALKVPKEYLGHNETIGIGKFNCTKIKGEINTESLVNYSNKMKEKVDHPLHYGGKDNPYEAIKVIEAWKLNFNLGNALKYISRTGKKDEAIQELEKAVWYLNREIENLKK